MKKSFEKFEKPGQITINFPKDQDKEFNLEELDDRQAELDHEEAMIQQTLNRRQWEETLKEAELNKEADERYADAVSEIKSGDVKKVAPVSKVARVAEDVKDAEDEDKDFGPDQEYYRRWNGYRGEVKKKNK